MIEIQYISDANGKPVGVIVPIELWEEIGSGELGERVNDLKKLFKKTQALPIIQTLSDEDISDEVDSYRNGR